MTNRNNRAPQREASTQRTAQAMRATSPKFTVEPERSTQPKQIARSQRAAPKTAITTEAVQRVQRSTAASNNGNQADWTRRLQSAADREAAKAKATGKPVGTSGNAAGPNGRNASRAKKND